MFHPRNLSLKTAIVGLLLCTAAALQAAEGLVSPTPVRTPPPSYPSQLKRDGISGTVALKVEVDETGAVSACTVSKSSNPGFEEAAINAVKGWKFTPAKRDGTPVKVTIVIPIRFSSED